MTKIAGFTEKAGGAATTLHSLPWCVPIVLHHTNTQHKTAIADFGGRAGAVPALRYQYMIDIVALQ